LALERDSRKRAAYRNEDTLHGSGAIPLPHDTVGVGSPQGGRAEEPPDAMPLLSGSSSRPLSRERDTPSVGIPRLGRRVLVASSCASWGAVEYGYGIHPEPVPRDHPYTCMGVGMWQSPSENVCTHRCHGAYGAYGTWAWIGRLCIPSPHRWVTLKGRTRLPLSDVVFSFQCWCAAERPSLCHSWGCAKRL